MPSIQEIERWYSEALSISQENRVQYLSSQLSKQPALLNEVLTLITSGEDEQSLLTQLRNQLIENQETELKSIPSIDRYDLIEEIGRGGMAVVYRAVRKDGVFDHEVAVKVLKRGMDTDEIVRRFRRERNLLGRLKHPNIAQIYDGGITSDGRPYFVMELIEGEELISYVEKNGLSEKDRLNLFVSVCKAVEFAHQNLIIHRDIKPSNLLVTKSGELKLMDFGIAKLLSPDDDQSLTIPESRVLTPKFASPEQINNEVVDIRSDVYQLGKVLELLLSDLINKDLESIILFAVREVREDRYDNVGEMEDDLRNYLTLKPVQAGNKRYVLRKYLSRNKTVVSVLFVSFLVLIVFSFMYISSLKSSYLRTERERLRSETTLNFLLDLFKLSDPAINLGDSLSVGFYLKEGIAKAEEIADGNTRAAIYNTIGNVYSSMGDPDRAYTFLNKALDLQTSGAVENRDRANSPYGSRGGR